jgi:Uma2 family endonuclease
MTTIVIADSVRIPAWVEDLETFRRWARSGEFPERGWYSYLNGELWADPSMEKAIHNLLTGAFALAIEGESRRAGNGRYFHDRMLLTHVEAELSTEPDGMFLSFAAIESGKVLLVDGAESMEVEGSPDMTLEVVSPTSVRKDTIILRDLYWKAGVQEYWLVHPTRNEVDFQILQHSARGYVSTRRQAGWVKSAVFGKAFRLVQTTDPVGLPQFSLEAR